MKNQRVTIAGMIGLIAASALGLAALRAASPLWTRAVCTACLTSLLVATLGACIALRRGPWLGYAVFGWGYLILSVGPWCDQNVAPALLSSKILDEVYVRIHPSSGAARGLGMNQRIWEAVDRARETNLGAFNDGQGGLALIQGLKPPERRRFEITGHSLLGMIHGLFGAMLGAWLSRRASRTESMQSASARTQPPSCR